MNPLQNWDTDQVPCRTEIHTWLVAVAVKAMIGMPGSCCRTMPSLRYAGLKSCPQELMQCASSTANKLSVLRVLMPFRRPRKPSVLSSSGVMKSSLTVGWGDLMSCRMLARSCQKQL